MRHDTLPSPSFPFQLPLSMFSSVKNAHDLSFQFNPKHMVQVILFRIKLSRLVVNSLHSQGSDKRGSRCRSFCPHFIPTKGCNELRRPSRSGRETLSLLMWIMILNGTFSWTKTLLAALDNMTLDEGRCFHFVQQFIKCPKVAFNCVSFRNGVETEERKDTMVRAENKSQPQGEMGTVITSGPKQVRCKWDDGTSSSNNWCSNRVHRLLCNWRKYLLFKQPTFY